MPTTRLPTQTQWRDEDWEGAAEMGFELPRVGFVTAEELTKERDRDGRDRLGQTQRPDSR